MKHAGRRRVPAFYARFSSDQQNPAGVDDQLARLRGYLDRSGESTDGLREFADSAVSGSMWKSRPGIQDMLRAVKRKEISCVYAEAVDRISRDPGHLAEFKKILAFYDTSFVSVSEGLKLDGSANAGTLFMLRSFTVEQSVAATADKAQRGLRANAEARRTTGGRTYGYARTKIGESRKGTAIRQNDIDPEQAAVVVQIFTMYATGLGYSAIAAALNAQGTPPPQRARGADAGWVSSCIREMLRNRRYIGDWSFGIRAHLTEEAKGRDSRLAGNETELAELEARISQNDDRLKRLYLGWADGEGGETLEQLMKELRSGLETDRAKVQALNAERSAGDVGRLPTAEEVTATARYVASMGFLNELDQEFADDQPHEVRVANMREALRAFLQGRVIQLHPEPDGGYRVDFVLLPAAMAEHKRRTPQLTAEAYDIRGCAGRI